MADVSHLSEDQQDHPARDMESSLLLSEASNDRNGETTEVGATVPSPLPSPPATTSSCRLVHLQAYSCVMAQILSFLGVLIVSRWVVQLGGLSWKQAESKLVFNWHPLLMVTAFFFMTVASLSFRTPLCSNNNNMERRKVKIMHGISWLVAALCALVALVAVFRSHNNPTSLIANLYSLHSWVGLTVIASYVVQFVVASFTFYDVCPNHHHRFFRMHESTKAVILKIHKFVGPSVYLATALTILLGIQEKEGFVGCAYAVQEPDVIPFRNVHKIPSSCLTSHGLGLIVLAVALLTSLTWFDCSEA